MLLMLMKMCMHKKNLRNLYFSEAINEALSISMKKNSKVLIIGLGVDDPKSIFGTTQKLKKKFGKNRVFDMPTAENGMTGIAIGASINGLMPVITHQRVEFALLSMEQIINQAAKWNYMGGGKTSIPLVIRIIIGRGWGNGPQHTQSLEALFASIPGLKVISPSTPYDAKGLLIASIEDKNPIIFFENRWLYHTYGKVPENYYKLKIGLSKVVFKGSMLTLVSNSYLLIECLHAAKVLKQIGLSIEVVDIRVLRPLDSKTILKSALKTKNLIVVDNGWPHYGISSEIISNISLQSSKKNISIKYDRLSISDIPIPSSRALVKDVYPSPLKISLRILKLLGIKNTKIAKYFKSKLPIDIPDSNFTGPF